METIITAHAGADGRPDNSMEFVEYALKCGADALEVDVRRRAGGVLAIGHDGLEAGAPSLAEVFLAVMEYPWTKVNCDLKEPGLEEAVCLLAEKAGLSASGRLILTGTVDAFRVAPGAEIFLNLEEYVPDPYRSFLEIPDFERKAAERICDICRRAGIRTVNACQDIVTRRFTGILAESGIGLSVWTVDDVQDLEWFLALGVQNITTRKLELALELRNRRREAG